MKIVGMVVALVAFGWSFYQWSKASEAGPPACVIRPGPSMNAKILAMPGSTALRPTTAATWPGASTPFCTFDYVSRTPLDPAAPRAEGRTPAHRHVRERQMLSAREGERGIHPLEANPCNT